MLPLMKAVPTSAAKTLDDPRWQHLLNREAGDFFYSVESTGIYCRPDCSSRLPLPENVRFFANAGDAERAGYRPCKRCKPNDSSPQDVLTQKIVDACRALDNEMIALDALAEKAQLSAHHFHRLFKKTIGITPKAYATAAREKRMKRELRRSPSITSAIYQAGYNSSARFYEASKDTLGMSAKAFRKGGENEVLRYAFGSSKLGTVLVAQSEIGICAIFLGSSQKKLLEDLQKAFPKASLHKRLDIQSSLKEVIALIDDGRCEHLPLDLRGTAFQKRVWLALQAIPAGETRSYSQIAEELGDPKAARAVAGACAANVLAVAIPCHRVVRSDGNLSGYRWGVEKKKALLEEEKDAP